MEDITSKIPEKSAEGVLVFLLRVNWYRISWRLRVLFPKILGTAAQEA
jgi:hypothetical protein